MAQAQFIQLGPFFVGGALQGSAKLYHYIAGTNTLKNIWSDRAETTTLAQPFVADAAGVFGFFADGLYKLVVTDANDVVLYTWDNWQIIDPTSVLLSEGASVASASTIVVGPEMWAHVTGSTTIAALSGTIPFFWAVFDGSLTITHSANLVCPGAVSFSVAAGDVVMFLNDGGGVWRVSGRVMQVLNLQADSMQIKVTDTRTNTVDVPLTLTSQTSNTPAAGIGTGILLQAESADEAPSDVGQAEFVFSDVAAGSEDSFFQVWLRVAGAALSKAYKWVTTTANLAIFSHANTADRTYTLVDRSVTLGNRYDAPSSTVSGSAKAHEGTVTISADQNLSGTHFYTDFTLNSGKTVTVPAGSRFLAIYATGTITINGTIDASGGGAAGGAGGAGGGGSGTAGSDGTDQPGGAGGDGGAGGNCYFHNFQLNSGSAQISIDKIPSPLPFPVFFWGGAGGGGGNGGDTGAGGNGGKGGASLVLIAPKIILGASATLTTAGLAGGNGAPNNGRGGGGGGAGNLFIYTHSFTDNGATITVAGGAAGSNPGVGGAASAGANGHKQINIY